MENKVEGAKSAHEILGNLRLVQALGKMLWMAYRKRLHIVENCSQVPATERGA